VWIALQAAICGHAFGANYNLVVPDRHRLEDSRLPDISANHPVKLVAEHNHVPLPVRICTVETGVYQTRMDDLTDAAMAALKDVLKRKDIQVTADAKKILSLVIREAHCVMERLSFSQSVLKFTVKLTVSFDEEDLIKEFTGAHGAGSGMAANSSISEAINQAVSEMLKDEEIREYLKR
jgi:hypothetical protein